MDDIFQTLAYNLRRYRQMRGLSIRALAEKAEASNKTICQLENGKTNVSVAYVMRLAAAMDLQASDLLRRPRPAKRESLVL